MASTSAISPVTAAALTKLRADAGVLARVTVDRIVDEAPSRFPGGGQYILVESSGERAFNTMGGTNDLPKFGSIAGLRVRIVGTYPVTDVTVGGTLSAIKACLDAEPLIVTGYQSVSVDYVNATLLRDTLSGVPTRELVADFDVTVHQS